MLKRLALCLLISFATPAWSAGPPVSRSSASSAIKHTKKQKKEKGKKKSKEEMSDEEKRAAEEEEKKRKEKLHGWSPVGGNPRATTMRPWFASYALRSPSRRHVLPEADLYQAGRGDRTVIPVQQPARVPDVNIPAVFRRRTRRSRFPTTT